MKVRVISWNTFGNSIEKFRKLKVNCSAKRIMHSTLFLFRKLEFWMGVKIIALVEELVPMYLYQIRPLKVTTDVLQEFWSKKDYHKY